GFTFNWSVKRDGIVVDTATGSPYVLTLTDSGVYVVSLTATDKDGGVSAPVTANFISSNVPPVVAIGGTNATFTEGSPVQLTEQVTDVPGDLAGLTYDWTVKRGGTTVASGTTATIAFTPSDNGSYVVTASAIDKDGAPSNFATATIAVVDAPPTGTFAASVL